MQTLCKTRLNLKCLVLLQIRGSKSRALHDRVLVNCQYSMAVFSTAERKRRPRGDRRSVEITRHLERTFSAAILTHLYPRSQIDIFVEVMHISSIKGTVRRCRFSRLKSINPLPRCRFSMIEIDKLARLFKRHLFDDVDFYI